MFDRFVRQTFESTNVDTRCAPWLSLVGHFKTRCFSLSFVRKLAVSVATTTMMTAAAENEWDHKLYEACMRVRLFSCLFTRRMSRICCTERKKTMLFWPWELESRCISFLSISRLVCFTIHANTNTHTNKRSAMTKMEIDRLRCAKYYFFVKLVASQRSHAVAAVNYLPSKWAYI